MQTDERVSFPCEDYQEPLSDSHINGLLGSKRLMSSALSIEPHALKILHHHWDLIICIVTIFPWHGRAGTCRSHHVFCEHAQDL